MDHNIILLTIIIFAAMVFLLRFVAALLYPLLLFLAAVFLFLAVKKLLRGGGSAKYASEETIEEREEGLSIKYSKIIIGLRKNFAEIRNSFLGDSAVGTLLEELDGALRGLLDANLELGRRASQMEQYLASIGINGLRVKQAEYNGRIRSETDEALKEEYRKAAAMIEETLASYANGERMIKLIDLEMARSGNYFDIVKLKIANLCVSKSTSARMEVEEICAEINKLFEDIEKLKKNFSQIDFNFPARS